MKNDKPKYSCPKCGGTEFLTELNASDRYSAVGDALLWQYSEPCDVVEFRLRCRECLAEAPDEFMSVAR